jgi:hypothetical protein
MMQQYSNQLSICTSLPRLQNIVWLWADEECNGRFAVLEYEQAEIADKAMQEISTTAFKIKNEVILLQCNKLTQIKKVTDNTELAVVVTNLPADMKIEDVHSLQNLVQSVYVSVRKGETACMAICCQKSE